MKTKDFGILGAEWVWNECKNVINTYVRFIQDFDSNDYVDVKFVISADTEYVAYINGHMVGYGQYDDYPFYKVYNEHEISSYIKKGKNRICILGYYQGTDTAQYYQSDAGIIFAVVGKNGPIALSGEGTFSDVCASYTNGEMEMVTGQLGYTFKYDASLDDNWNNEEYIPITFTKCIIIDKGLVLHERPIRYLLTKDRVISRLCAQGFLKRDEPDSKLGLLLQHDYFSARRIFEISDYWEKELKLPQETPFTLDASLICGDGVYLLFDLGWEEVGLLDIEIDAAKETVFEIGYGEHLDDLRVRSGVGNRNFACRYISKEGRQRFTHYMKRVGCRYIQLHISNIKNDVKIYYAGVLPVTYPLNHTSIDIKDKLHKEIYNVAVRTIELCMHEHYEDCPWREQALYTMDSRNQALCGYYCFEEYDFPESCIKLFSVDLKEDGLLELCAPSKQKITIPSFTYIWVLELYEFWVHSGRTEFLGEMFPVLKKICESAISRLEDGLVPCFIDTRYWNFYEWSDELDGTPIFRDYKLENRYDAPLNMFLVIALEKAVIMASELGEKQLAVKWIENVNILRENINKAFLDNKANLYYTYISKEKKWHNCELTQALAICSGCAEQNVARELRKKLTIENNGLIPTTLSYMVFKYDALLKDADNYGEWVFNDIAKIWGGMLFKGATSFWETENGACEFDNAGSLCHGWSSIPVYYYHKFAEHLK